MQVVTLCISTTMVLILLGLVVMSVLLARNLSSYVKENLTVTVMLSDDMKKNEADILRNRLYKRGYVKNVNYISKEQAKVEQSKAMGSDPSEFLGFNPFTATLEIQLRSAFVHRDSLKWISAELKKLPRVTDIAYQEDLMDKVNNNLRKVNIALIVLAALLMCVSVSLINNTVKLDVYSRRFLIHTMKLVGASWGFIRKPFVLKALWVGLSASLLACGVLAAGMYALYRFEPNLLAIVTWQELAITGASVFVLGIVITQLCSYFSVNRFLKMTAGDLYKI